MPTHQMTPLPSWQIGCLNCFLRRWYLLESFDTLFKLNSLPLVATVTSNNCATTMCNVNERSQWFELQSIRREQLSVHLRTCAYLCGPCANKTTKKTTNTQKTPSDGNRSTFIPNKWTSTWEFVGLLDKLSIFFYLQKKCWQIIVLAVTHMFCTVI